MPRYHRLALIAIGIILFLTNLGATRLWDVDEAIFSQAAVEMWERGDWVTPYFNGQLFAHKPPVMYWCQMVAFEVFGPTELAARFFSAICGIVTMLVTYELGKLLFNARTGLWAGIALGSCVNFAVIARAATPDAYLTFVCTVAMYLLVRGTRTNGEGPWRPRLPASWRTYALAYSAMAVAVLVKGPIGIVIPTAVWGMFLLIEQRAVKESKQALPPNAAPAANWKQRLWSSAIRAAALFEPRYFLQTVWRMHPLTAIAAMLLIAGPWYALVGIRTNGQFLREFFLVHNFGRATQAMEHHGGPFYYYLVAICIGTFPWCLFLGPALGNIVRAVRKNHECPASYVLISCWACVWVGGFTLIGTKLPSYIVPAYPALALGFAALIDGWLDVAATVDCRRWLRAAWSVMAVVGVGILIALPIVTRMFLAGEWTPAIIGVVPITGAIAGLWFSEHGQRGRSLAVMAVVGVVFSTGLLGFAVLPIDAHQNSYPFMECVRANAAGTPSVASCNYFQPSLVFYAGQPVQKIEKGTQISGFFESHPYDAFLFTTVKQYEAIREELPADVVVLCQERQFLRKGELVLLGRVVGNNVATRARSTLTR